MPLAVVPFDRFWGSGMPDAMANFLQAQGFPARDAGGQVLRPGRPIADPGPDRTVRQGPTTLSAANSLFANTYAWSIVSGPNGAVPPAGATLTNATAAQATFNATVDGTYVVQLVASSGGTASAPALLTIVVNNALAPAPDAIRFADIKARLQSPAAGCTGCHTPAFGAPVVSRISTAMATARGGRCDRRSVVLHGGARAHQLHRPRREPAAQQTVGQSPLRRTASGLQYRPRRRARPHAPTTICFLNWILNGAPQ